MEWFDELSKVVVNFGHRLVLELVFSVVVFAVFHLFMYPMMQNRAHSSTPEPSNHSTKQETSPAQVTTGSITTTAPSSPVIIGNDNEVTVGKDKANPAKKDQGVAGK